MLDYICLIISGLFLLGQIAVAVRSGFDMVFFKDLENSLLYISSTKARYISADFKRSDITWSGTTVASREIGKLHIGRTGIFLSWVLQQYLMETELSQTARPSHQRQRWRDCHRNKTPPSRVALKKGTSIGTLFRQASLDVRGS